MLQRRATKHHSILARYTPRLSHCVPVTSTGEVSLNMGRVLFIKPRYCRNPISGYHREMSRFTPKSTELIRHDRGARVHVGVERPQLPSHFSQRRFIHGMLQRRVTNHYLIAGCYTPRLSPRVPVTSTAAKRSEEASLKMDRVLFVPELSLPNERFQELHFVAHA